MVDLAPFNPTAVGTENPAPAATKPKRRAGTRKPKKVKAPKVSKSLADAIPPLPFKKPRKPRAAKIAKANPTGKLGINEIVSATVGLKEDEAKTLLKIVGMLADHKKSAKPKILSALGKLFA